MIVCFHRSLWNCLPLDTSNISIVFLSYILPCFLQALYFCVPFREQLLEYYVNNKSLADTEENLLTCLADLFSQVQHYPRLMDSYFST